MQAVSLLNSRGLSTTPSAGLQATSARLKLFIGNRHPHGPSAPPQPALRQHPGPRKYLVEQLLGKGALATLRRDPARGVHALDKQMVQHHFLLGALQNVDFDAVGRHQAVNVACFGLAYAVGAGHGLGGAGSGRWRCIMVGKCGRVVWAGEGGADGGGCG